MSAKKKKKANADGEKAKKKKAAERIDFEKEVQELEQRWKERHQPCFYALALLIVGIYRALVMPT